MLSWQADPSVEMQTLKPRIKVIAARITNHTTASIRERGRPWRRARDQALQRAFGMCELCRKIGRIRLAREVDHIAPLAAGGSDELHNLQALCIECHEAKTKAEQCR